MGHGPVAESVAAVGSQLPLLWRIALGTMGASSLAQEVRRPPPVACSQCLPRGTGAPPRPKVGAAPRCRPRWWVRLSAHSPPSCFPTPSSWNTSSASANCTGVPVPGSVSGGPGAPWRDSQGKTICTEVSLLLSQPVPRAGWTSGSATFTWQGGKLRHREVEWPTQATQPVRGRAWSQTQTLDSQSCTRGGLNLRRQRAREGGRRTRETAGLLAWD